MAKYSFAFFLAVSLLLTGPIQAQLTWDKPEQEFYPKLEDAKLTAGFSFKNTGPDPISIRLIHASCGCMTTTLDKKDYAPGDTGSLRVTMNFGSKSGIKEENVLVVTSDRKNPHTRLMLKVHIPDILKITPPNVRWDIGQAADPKILKVEVIADKPVRVVGVESNHDQIFSKLRTIKPGKEYEIEIRPLNTVDPASAIIQIETNFPKGSPRFFQAQARVGPDPGIRPKNSKASENIDRTK